MKRLTKAAYVSFGIAILSGVLSGYAPTSAPTLPELLEQSGLHWEEVDDGYRVRLMEDFGLNAIVRLREISDGVAVIYIYSRVLAVPEGFQHPPAMLRRILELNDKIPVGNISLSGKKGSVFYNSSSWLDYADGAVLRREILYLNTVIPMLRSELEGYLSI